MKADFLKNQKLSSSTRKPPGIECTERRSTIHRLTAPIFLRVQRQKAWMSSHTLTPWSWLRPEDQS